jgi:hypothetical protein
MGKDGAGTHPPSHYTSRGIRRPARPRRRPEFIAPDVNCLTAGGEEFAQNPEWSLAECGLAEAPRVLRDRHYRVLM